jgi:hypothetical protein
VFAIARTPYGKMMEQKQMSMNWFVNALMKLWRYLRLSTKGPKIHGVEDHFRQQMNEIGGIGNFLEDFVEQGRKRLKSVENVDSGKYSFIDDFRGKGGIRRSTE